ncbi:core histone macro-H2A.1 [Strongylocentrotus purpuratus]|uniref:Macro domain-containing protein n=1 Tax=Strongylocentrotus purpuratus TaxID=7668 RepID=A0A7M7TGB9_STRPU|nr:core histone macro-H2A.1 [Strongylocentrotus purpuratus]|eukprot:XP_781668.1 PREDICTED: core histone macro-H2A.1 [Strongylocentrotus purpuratus]
MSAKGGARGVHSGRGGKTRGKSTSRSAKAGVLFPVGRMDRYLRMSTHHYRIGSGAPVYLAAVIEYLTAEILELAGNAARDNKKARVTPRHILLAVANDEELHHLLKNVTIASGGVLPQIHPELLMKKRGSKAKSVFDFGQKTPAAVPVPKKPKTPAEKKQLPAVKKPVVKKAALTPKPNAAVSKGKTISGKSILGEKKLFLGQKLTVVKADLTEITADALVHPTNSTYAMAGEVGSALEKVGGRAFVEEVAKLRAAQSLDISGAAICPAHNLPAKYVIHVNSPSWGGANAVSNLEKCIKNCLALADEKNITSIAIPSVSSGRAGFPKQIAAETILRTISHYFVSVMASSLKQIYFVLFDQESVEVYVTELNRLEPDQ